MCNKIIAEFTTIDEQIEILKRRHLLFLDEKLARDSLQAYGYYTLINGYKEPYVYLDEDGNEFYKEGTYFEQICSLFNLDAELRYAVLTSMLALEDHLRSVTSYVIGEHFGSDDSVYLNRENYKDRPVSNKNFSLDSILDTMQHTLRSNREPILYHRQHYNNVPPWILVKGLYMNTLVNFIRFQKKYVKEEMLHIIYGISPEVAALDSVKELFMSTLFISLDYRNMAAHGGRTYNFAPHSKLRLNNSLIKELSMVLDCPVLTQKTCNINQLFYLLRLFRLEPLHLNMLTALEKEVSRHCTLFPNDIHYIQDATGVLFDLEITEDK